MPLNAGGGDSLFFKTGIDTKGMAAGSKATKGILAGLTRSITSMNVFGGFALSGSLAFGIIAKKSFDFMKEFESAMIEVSTISDEVTKDIEGVSEAIIKLSRGLPQGAASLAKAEYQIISAGITDVSESLDILRISAELATAGLTTTFTAADALTSIINAYGLQAGTAEEISDKLFTTVRLGKINMEQLATQIGMVTGLSASVGLEFDSLLASIAEGTKTVRPEIFFTAIRGLLTSLISPADDAIKTAKLLGIEWSTAAVRAKGLSVFLKELAEVTGSSEKIIGKLLPNVRGIIGLLAIAREEGDAFAKTLDEYTRAEGARVEALGKQLEETGNKTKIMMNNLLAETKGVGTAILSFFDKFAGKVNDFYARQEALTKERLRSRIQIGGELPGAPPRLKSKDELLGIFKEFDLKVTNTTILDMIDKYNDKTTTLIYRSKLARGIFRDILVLFDEKEKAAQKYADGAEQRAIDEKARAEAERIRIEKDKKAAEDNLARIEINAQIEADLAKISKNIDDDLTDNRLENMRKQAKAVEEGREKTLAEIKKEDEKALKDASKAELKLHDKKFRNLLKNYNKFTDKKLEETIEALKLELEAEEWAEGEKEILTERLADLQEENFMRSMKHIEELGKGFESLGKIVGMYNKELGGSLETFGQMARQMSSFIAQMTSGNYLGAAATAIGTVAGAIAGGGDGGRAKHDDIGRRADARSGFATGIRAIIEDESDAIIDLTNKLELAKNTLPALIALLEEFESVRVKSQFIGAFGGAQRGVTEEEKQRYLNQVKDLNDEINQILTGTTANSIADGIADGFASGLNSAEVFVNSFEDIMQGALKDIFKRTLQEKFLNQWYEDLADAIESGGALTSAEAFVLGEGLEDIIAQAKTIRQTLFGEAGLPGFLTDGTDASDSQRGISGAISGITETTAGALEGQFNAMRIEMVGMNFSLQRLDEVADNTFRTAQNTEFLKAINTHLAAQSLHQNTILRSMGLT